MTSMSSPLDWMSLLTSTAANTEKSLIREMFARLRKGDITSFAGGMPDTQLFPYSHVQTAMKQIMDDDKQRVTALNYGPSEGYLPLRQWISALMRSLGVTCDSDNILLTSGGQQGLDLICRSMIEPGDTVMVAAPTYLGAIQILRTYGANIIGIRTDSEGPVPEYFKTALEKKPKFVYLVSDFSNPTGQTISQNRRKVLISLARSKGVPIIDDAAYQQLRFVGEAIDPMMAYDQHVSSSDEGDPLSHGGVIHVGTFSKTMMPGLRIGWIVAPQAYLKGVIPLKQATDLHSPLLNQMVTYNVVSEIHDAHIKLLRETYQRKRNAMILAMRKYLPQALTYSEPEGGMFVWVTLPEGCDAVELLNRCMEEAKVAYIPGAPFFSEAGQGKRYCRFSFSGLAEDQINQGVERYGAFMSSALST